MPIENFKERFQSYPGISEMVKQHSYAELFSHIAGIVNVDEKALLAYPMGGYSKGKTSGSYQYVLQDLKKNITRFDRVYEMLADETSRTVFTKLIQFRLIPDIQFIEAACDTGTPQYFDKSFVTCTTEEVFVDCGGFTGDTTEEYIRQYGEYKRIYIYEPSDDNIATCQANLAKYPNIIVRNCGVGEQNEQLPISNSRSSSSFIGNVNSDTMIDIISLDEDIKEPVSFIKMDIEGFEIPALLGAKNHIKNDTPKLAVCTYHILSDMWEIPLLIHSINPNYKYYFRHYQPDQNWETVVYAIPKRAAVPVKTVAPKHCVALPWREGWTNVELTKDCGLIPYLLHKNHGFDVTMTGADHGPYPYLTEYVDGLHMDFLSNGSVLDKVKYILHHGRDIDLLLLRGAYDTNIDVALQYKQVNPNGKIYVGLDANSHWMDRILWDRPEFIAFMNCCDVIATSCRALQRHLNEKWPWKVEYIPNGYYSFHGSFAAPDYSKKENTILTVSRLGTPQKATPVLLEAFAQIADKLPAWNLKLVGSEDGSFTEYKESYFKKYPQLASRVQFTGVISDKTRLYEEYQKAKIFALPSTFEGAPNVISEALIAGCATAVTRFDAWEDAVDEGRCGLAADINDTAGFAEILLTLCTHPQLSQMCANAYQYALRNFDMEAIVAKLYELLYGGDFL